MFIGSCTTYLFQKSGVRLPVLYFFDLSGASFGAIISIYMMNNLGPVRSAIILIFILCTASWVLYRYYFQDSKRWWPVWVSVTAAAIFLFSVNTNALLIPAHNVEKDMIHSLHDPENRARIIDTRWTSFGRSDLVEKDNQSYKTLYIDGAAGTRMLRMENGMLDQMQYFDLRYNFVAGIVLNTLSNDQKKDALVIGSGGGIDVVALLVNDFQRIKAVEINPDFIELVKKYGAYNGNLYNGHPRVQVINKEGRSYIRTSDDKYDVILVSLPLIKSTRSYGNYALTENYLYTYDAFMEYRNSLNDDGYMIIVAHNAHEVYRITTNVVRSFELESISADDAMKHIAVIGKDPLPALIMKKSPFTSTETDRLHQAVMNYNQLGGVIFIPNLEQHDMAVKRSGKVEVVKENMLDTALYWMSTGQIDLKSLIKISPINISHISDNSPFFYNWDNAIPPEILGIIIISTILLILFIIMFLSKVRKNTDPTTGRYIYSFGILGIAFIVTEVAVIQRFLFFWGQNTIALAFVLSLILLSTGTGSLASTYLKNDRLKLQLSFVMIPILSALFYFVYSKLMLSHEGAQTLLKALLTAGMIFPLFFFMGFPYPTLLKSVWKLIGRDVFPWMIGSNSLATLIGGSIAVSTAMIIGYHFVLLIGGVLYLSLIFTGPMTTARIKNQFFYSVAWKEGCHDQGL
jgi:predicted membrane-bound spermidine synthase